MRTKCFALAFITLTGLAGCGGSNDSQEPAPEPPKPAYPQTRSGTDSDVYFGRAVADPYRWLEDIESAETDAWVRAQNQLTAQRITEMPDYAALSARISQWFAAPAGATKQSGLGRQEDIHVEGVQGRDGKYYYQIQQRQRQHDFMRPGQQPAFLSVDNAIYVARSASDTEQGKRLVDTSVYRIDPDDNIQLQRHQLSPNGKYLAYALVRNYADVAELHVLDLQQPGQVPMVRVSNAYSGAFTLMDDGISYASPRQTVNPHVSPHTYQTLYFLSFADMETQAWVQGEQFDQIGPSLVHGNYLYYEISTAMRGAIGRIDLTHPENGAELVLDLRSAKKTLSLYGVSPDDPNKLLILTSQGAALNRLVEIDPNNPDPANWRELLPNSAPGVTEYANTFELCGGDHYAEHLVQGSSTLVHYNSSGRHEIPLPGAGTVDEMQCHDSNGQTMLSYVFSSLSQPHVRYNYDPVTHSVTQVASSRYAGYDPSQYEMRRLTATSKDGTQFPVYIAHKKGLKPDGEAPTMIYVYGGFFTAVTPTFMEKLIPLLESGGIYAVAQVRGGSEFGMDWYDAGRLLNKQNTYDDIAAAATQLISEGLTRPGKLALQGESNGGLSTAALGLQRPDLFAVVFPTVGVLDLVRYDRFSSGFGWHADYGQVTRQDEFENLMRFSPLHNVKPQAYPPTYVFTGKSDGRVMPAHSYKYAATLQNTATGSAPYLLYAYPKDGHSLESNRQSYLTYMWTAFFHHTNSRYTAPN